MDQSDRPPTVTTTTSAAPESPSEADIGEWITVPLASIPGSVVRQIIESMGTTHKLHISQHEQWGPAENFSKRMANQ
ncbi:hypothetical protein RvY_18593 [Ramazzottius varieornatus]|uniref:Uncharacterized protein n=1 Tax=Ramazzottius varieornatus TaxID=947166 RepID=A0A1D1W6C3_RAMVA|nr:hypothetical protein RvY_18593 [Ramazzottius varieornatus]